MYFLFGKNDQDEDEVYIGQAGIRKNGEGVLFRVAEHLKDSAYFSEAVILTTQNNSFGPTEISYLENRFTKLAIETDRYKVRNSNDPNPGNVTEEKESELEDFIEYSQMVLGVLAYKIFVPIITQKTEETKEEEDLLLYLSRKTNKSGGRRIEAQCKRTSEGFVVLKGSMIDAVDTAGLATSIQELRAKCMANGEIVDGRITKNYLFDTPSGAASFVIGTNVNGRTYWKNANRVTLKELEEKEMEP